MTLFSLTQVRSIHYKAAAFLFTTSLLLLGILAWQLTAALSDPLGKKIGFAALLSTFIAPICMAGLLGVSWYALGLVSQRILAPANFLQVVPGLLWGACIGYLINRIRLATGAHEAWLWGIGLAGLFVTLIIGTGIVIDHSKFIPKLATYAREWDARTSRGDLTNSKRSLKIGNTTDQCGV